MKKQVSILLIAAVVLTAVFVAGCTSQTASPTPSPSAAPSTGTAKTATASVKPVAATALPNSTDLSSYLTSYVQTQGYTVVTPFNKSVSNATGNDLYTGTITDGTSVYVASYQITKSSTDTTNVFNSATSNLQQQGFASQQTNSTTWIGYNSNNGYSAYVSQDTTDNYVFLLIQAPIGS